MSVSEWYVEDHLCECSAGSQQREMEEGLGEFLTTSVFAPKFEIRPIEQEETCDVAGLSRLDQSSGKRPRFRKYILDTSLVCTDHAAEMNQKSEKT